MWQPKEEGITELIKLFNHGKGTDNKKHLELYNVIML